MARQIIKDDLYADLSPPRSAAPRPSAVAQDCLRHEPTRRRAEFGVTQSAHHRARPEGRTLLPEISGVFCAGPTAT